MPRNMLDHGNGARRLKARDEGGAEARDLGEGRRGRDGARGAGRADGAEQLLLGLDRFELVLDRAHEDEAGLRRSQALVDGLLAREQARGVPASRTVLAGFSQGCAMALLTGLRYGQRLAGVAGMSGYPPLARQLVAERSAANADVPIWLAHGTQDEMVALPRAEASRDALQALGYAVEWHSYPMGHSVCMEEVADLQRWLLKVLAA